MGASYGPVSPIDISNRSLGVIGTRSSIVSFDENSNEARNCALFYTSTRDQLLRMARWNFARRMITLTLLKAAPGTPENPNPPPNGVWNGATMPQIPWLYSYAYPPDCLLMQRVPLQFPGIAGGTIPLTTAPANTWQPYNDVVSSAKFAVAQDQDPTGAPIKCVLTNAPVAIGVFTAVTDDSTLFDALFTEALVQALAGHLARALTGDKTLAKQCWDQANAMVIQARVSDGDEAISQVDHLPDWMAIRGGPGWPYSLTGIGVYAEPYAPFFGWGGGF